MVARLLSEQHTKRSSRPTRTKASEIIPISEAFHVIWCRSNSIVALWFLVYGFVLFVSFESNFPYYRRGMTSHCGSVYGLVFFAPHYSLSLYLASFSLLLRPKLLTPSFTFDDCCAPLPYHLCSPLPFFYNFKRTFLFCFAIIQLGHPGIAQLVARLLWDFISLYPLDFLLTAEPLGTLRKTRFSDSRKIPAKVVYTTCLLLQNKISYSFPGVAQLVARVVWDHQAAGSNPVTRTKTPQKPMVSEEFSLL